MSSIVPSYSQARSGANEMKAKLFDLSEDLDKFAPEHRSQVLIDRLRQQKLRAMISLAKAQQFLAETDVLIADYNLQAVAQEFEHMKKERNHNDTDMRLPQNSESADEKLFPSTDHPTSSGELKDDCTSLLTPAVDHYKSKEKGTDLAPKGTQSGAQRSCSKTENSNTPTSKYNAKNKTGNSEPTTKINEPTSKFTDSSKTYEPSTSKAYKESSNNSKATSSKTYKESSKSKEAATSKTYESTSTKVAATSKAYESTSTKVASTSKAYKSTSTKEAATLADPDLPLSANESKKRKRSKSKSKDSKRHKSTHAPSTEPQVSAVSNKAPASSSNAHKVSSNAHKVSSNAHTASSNAHTASSNAHTASVETGASSKSKTKESKRHKSSHTPSTEPQASAESIFVPAASSNAQTASSNAHTASSNAHTASSNENTASVETAASPKSKTKESKRHKSSHTPSTEPQVSAVSIQGPALSSNAHTVSSNAQTASSNAHTASSNVHSGSLGSAMSSIEPTAYSHSGALYLISHAPNCDCKKINRTEKEKTLLNTSISPIKKISDVCRVINDKKTTKNDKIETDVVKMITKGVQTDPVIIVHVENQTMRECPPDFDDEETMQLDTLPEPHTQSIELPPSLAKALEQIKSQKTTASEHVYPIGPGFSDVTSHNMLKQSESLIQYGPRYDAEAVDKTQGLVKMELPDHNDIPNTSTEICVNNLYKDIMKAKSEEISKDKKSNDKVMKRGLWKILNQC